MICVECNNCGHYDDPHDPKKLYCIKGYWDSVDILIEGDYDNCPDFTDCSSNVNDKDK